MTDVRRYNLPDDAVPLVPETAVGRQITGQELYEARWGGGWGSEHHLTKSDQKKWNDAAECLNLRVAEIGDEYSELRQKAAAWDVVAEHPVIGEISTLPDADTYADQVYARLDEIATEREPWDVLREAANYLDVPGRFDVSESVRGYADRLEREAAEKLQREREIKAVAHALHGLHGQSKSWDHQAEVAIAALDAVRGDSGE